MPDALKRLLTRELARSVLIFLLIFSALFILFLWHLGSMTKGLGPAEAESVSSSSSLARIASNPIDGPYKMLQFLLYKYDSPVLSARLPSVLIGLLSVGSFYVIARRWFGRMVGFFGTILFASLPWVIISSRTATPQVMYLAICCLVAAYVWLTVSEHKTLPVLTLAGLITWLIYTPGIIWFILVGGLLWWRKLAKGAEGAAKLAMPAAILVFLVGITPLVFAASQDLNILKRLVLLPESLASIFEIAKSLVWGVLGLFWETRDGHPLTVGKLPLLNVTASVLSVFGVYVMWTRARTELYGLLSLIVIAIAGYGLNRNLGLLAIAFPSFGILMTAGLRYLYAEWRGVFPRNPLPRVLALMLVVGLIAINLMFGMRYALDAWPNTPQTKATFVIK